MQTNQRLYRIVRNITVSFIAAIAFPAMAASSSAPAPDYLQMLMSLLVVLGLIFALAFVAKKMRLGPANQHGVKLVASLALGAKERVVVVEVEEQQYMLGVTGQQINLLQKLDKNISKSETLGQTANMPIDILSLLKKGK